MTSCNITVSVYVSKYAFEILKLLKRQNSSLFFELDEENREIKLSNSMLDFPDISDDGGFDNAVDFPLGVD